MLNNACPHHHYLMRSGSLENVSKKIASADENRDTVKHVHVNLLVLLITFS